MGERSSIQERIETLAKSGLNLFASAPIEAMPEDLKSAIGASIPEQRSPDDFRSFVLLGHGGTALWENLPKPVLEEEHPFDTFADKKIDELIRATGAQKVLKLFPNPNSVLPLQRFGRFFGWGRPSPLGIDIHHRYGLWFAYRGAFLTSLELPLIADQAPDDICSKCATRECQYACPAHAVGLRQEDFRLPGCASFRLSEGSPCAASCLSRIACPYGREHRYSSEQLHYHMSRKAHLKKLKEI